jgi:hypothetical protein
MLVKLRGIWKYRLTCLASKNWMSHFLVRSQIRSEREHLVTQVTRKSTFYHGMDFFVGLQKVHSVEHLFTCFTFKWFFLCMGDLMAVQVPHLWKSLITLVARMRFLAGMYTFVNIKCTFHFKGSVTNITLVCFHFHPIMGFQVFLQQWYFYKHFTTDLTAKIWPSTHNYCWNIHFLIRMGFLMHLQCLPSEKQTITHTVIFKNWW